MLNKRNRSRRALSRRRRTTQVFVLLGAVLGAVLIGSILFDDMGLSKYLAMRKQAQQLEKEIRELEESNATLREEIDRIQNDPARLEELARERLGFVRKGETVYQAVQDPEK